MKYLGHLVKISFLDHVASIGGLSEPIQCCVYGVVVKEDKKCFYVASWLSEGNLDENSDVHTILKSTVGSVVRFKKEIVLK